MPGAPDLSLSSSLGAALDAAWVDAVAGLVVAVGIRWLLVRSARRMWRRVLDGIEPDLVDDVKATIRTVDGVHDVTDLRVRWHVHQLLVAASVAVDADLTVKVGHDTAHDVEHALHHRFTFPVAADIHVDAPRTNRRPRHHGPPQPLPRVRGGNSTPYLVGGTVAVLAAASDSPSGRDSGDVQND